MWINDALKLQYFQLLTSLINLLLFNIYLKSMYCVCPSFWDIREKLKFIPFTFFSRKSWRSEAFSRLESDSVRKYLKNIFLFFSTWVIILFPYGVFFSAFFYYSIERKHWSSHCHEYLKLKIISNKYRHLIYIKFIG